LPERLADSAAVTVGKEIVVIGGADGSPTDALFAVC
jgi:hypothetical protein